MESGRRPALLDAALVELGEKGYAGIELEAILDRAGASRAEFEAEFGGELDSCLFAAYEELTGDLVARSCAVCETDLEWPERVRRGLAVLLEAIAENPRKARLVTRTFPAIRPAAYERYTAFLGSFTPYLREGREYSGVEEELPGEVELMAVGAGESLIFGEVDAGRAAQLPEMLPEILFSVLVQFMGPERAAEEMRSAATAG
jgi:AcrR family transcriptional regulator